MKLPENIPLVYVGFSIKLNEVETSTKKPASVIQGSISIDHVVVTSYLIALS